MTRMLAWDGTFNVRDLGGLPAGTDWTRHGRFVRGPRPELLTTTGWQHATNSGIRTVVDLRNANEFAERPRPATVTTIDLPIEDQLDRDFMAVWGEHLNSPRYYRENLRRWPEKVVAVFRAFAAAPPGGILFHCAGGRDRTGLISALLLRLCGVGIGDVVQDYLISLPLVNDRLRAEAESREPAKTDDELREHASASAIALQELLDDLDVAAYLRRHGLSATEIDSVRARLLAP